MATAHEPTISSEDVKKIEELFIEYITGNKPKTLKILITGKTGVGKSRLVNAIIGKKVAKEGKKKDPCTSEVTSYEVIIHNVKVIVWDSPGLQDGTNKESEYIQDMKDKVKDPDLMIYCVKMDDTRFYDADKKAIKTLTDKFGPDIWKHAVVSLTFANKVEDPDEEDESEYFEMQLQNWKIHFKDYFAVVGVNPEVSIPVIPVGNTKKSMRLPDRDNWLADLWITSYQVMKASARQGILQINRGRLRSDDSTTTSSSASRFLENDIPSDIPLNNQHQKSFWKSTWEGFQSFCGIVFPVISTIVTCCAAVFDAGNGKVCFRYSSKNGVSCDIFMLGFQLFSSTSGLGSGSLNLGSLSLSGAGSGVFSSSGLNTFGSRGLNLGSLSLSGAGSGVFSSSGLNTFGSRGLDLGSLSLTGAGSGVFGSSGSGSSGLG